MRQLQTSRRGRTDMIGCCLDSTGSGYGRVNMVMNFWFIYYADWLTEQTLASKEAAIIVRLFRGFQCECRYLALINFYIIFDSHQTVWRELWGPKNRIQCATGRGSPSVTPLLTYHVVIQVGTVAYWRDVRAKLYGNAISWETRQVEQFPWPSVVQSQHVLLSE
jgi:hypothetical protein